MCANKIILEIFLSIELDITVRLFSCQNQSTSKKESSRSIPRQGFSYRENILLFFLESGLKSKKIPDSVVCERYDSVAKDARNTIYLDDDVIDVILMMRSFNMELEIKYNYYFILTKRKSFLIGVSS